MGLHRLAKGLLGLVPEGIVAVALLGSQGYREVHVLETELAVNLLGHGQVVGHRGGNLVFAHEHVAVVLAELAHAKKHLQRAAGLIAEHLSELEQGHGQLAVAAAFAAVQLNVVGAAHRTQGVPCELVGGRGILVWGHQEHGVAVLFQVARLGECGHAHEAWAFYFQVAGVVVHLADETAQLFVHFQTSGLPVDHAGRRPDV